MATINDVVEGLKIFAKYSGDKHDVCADHDIIYAGAAANSHLSPEDIAELEKLGWHFDKESFGWARFV